MKLLIALLFFIGCTSTETRLREEFEIPAWQMQKIKDLAKKPVIAEDSIYLDARPFFLYQLSHIEKAYHMNPEDFFSLDSKSAKVAFTTKHFFNARRFSRYGIAQHTPVISIGRGIDGDGEEWLLALYLEYLGVEKVIALDPGSMSFKEGNVIPILPKSEKIWKPKLVDNLIMDDQSLTAIRKNNDLNSENTLIVDTRDAQTYLNSSLSTLSDIPRVNIPWREFIDANSRPNSKIFESLINVGLRPEKRILCYGAKPGHAAVACMVLREMGFSNAGIYLQ